MSFSAPRWVCPRCGSNNMPQVATCFRCGSAPAPPPPPPPAIPVAIPAAAARRSPGWPRWLSALVFGLVLLPFVGCLAGLILYSPFARMQVETGAPGNAGPVAREEDVFRIHARDLRGRDPVTGERLIRCHLCAGDGLAWKWGHTGDGKDLNQYYRTGQVACPHCNGTGQMRESSISSRVIVVPDLQVSDYSEDL